MSFTYYTCKCSKCNRKILVEITTIGADCDTEPIVNCAQCLSIVPAYRTSHPKETEDIERWQRGDDD